MKSTTITLKNLSNAVDTDKQQFNHLGVHNDQDALALFLRRAGRRSKETYRRYARELVRFTAFSRKELQKNYRQITLADVEIYVNFLHNPSLKWQRPGINKNDSEKIYFPSPVKPGKSTDMIITVLSSFFGYLHITGYLDGNPFRAFDKSGEKQARGHGHPRYFFNDEWQVVLTCIKNYSQDTEIQRLEKARIRYIFSLAYGGALRESEISGHTCADIKPDVKGYLTIYLHGKGRRLRQLPMTTDMLKAVNDYRILHGAGQLTADNFPFAPKLRPVEFQDNGEILFKAIGSRQLRKWFAQFMQYCASNITDNELAGRLQKKSFHSLRHTALSHLAQKMDVRDLSIFAGHESIITTQQYYTPEKDVLRRLTQDHCLLADE